jgi:mannosyltransferase
VEVAVVVPGDAATEGRPGSDDWGRILGGHPAMVLGAVALGVFAVWYWNPHYRYDEYLVAVARTRLTWHALIREIVNADPGAGALYLLMKPWTWLSSDPWWTRIPSLVAMAIAVVGTVSFVRLAGDDRTAMYAGLVMIALPGASRWAEDNRMYAPAIALLVLALVCWWRWVTGGSLRWAAGYTASVAGMGLLHLYTLAWLPALAVGALGLATPRRRTLQRTLIPAAIAVALLAPLIYLNLAHPTGAPGNPAPTIVALGAMVGLNLGVLLGPLLIGVAALGAAVGWQDLRCRPIAVLGVAWVTLPTVEFLGMRVLLGMPTLLDRYWVFAIPGVAILAGLGISAVHARRPRAALILLAVGLALSLPSQVALRAADAHRPDTYRLGLLLAQPELSGLPLVAATRTAGEFVNAATYPIQRQTDADAPAEPVALVAHMAATPTARFHGRYVEPDGPWRPVLECAFGDNVVVRVVAQPEAAIPAGSAERLATLLNERVGITTCRPMSAAP